MYLFKTSGETIPRVVETQKHAFASLPGHWNVGETVLLSKNKNDLEPEEKQIQYLANIDDIRPIRPGEAEKYWGAEYEGKWRHLVELSDVTRLAQPFDLADAIGAGAADYWGVRTFCRLDTLHEVKILRFLKETGQRGAW